MQNDLPLHNPRVMQLRINARCNVVEKARRRAANRIARNSRRINRRSK